MADEVKLLPCPFCGGEAEFERIGNRAVSTQVTCSNCGCFLESGEEQDGFPKPGRRWNERTNKPSFAMGEVLDAARDLVALWNSPKIAELPRAERNAAIDETLEKLKAAVAAWEEWAVDQKFYAIENTETES